MKILMFKVQQDLMRSNSAISYIDDTEKISSEFVEMLEKALDKNKEIDDLLDFLNPQMLNSLSML